MCEIKNCRKVIEKLGGCLKMYGTTMKNYNVNKASSSYAEKNTIFGKRNSFKEKRAKKEEDTRYMKLESTAEMPADEVSKSQKENEAGLSKKDFPIPSVIITVLLTMMLLVVGTGLLGM